MKHSLKLEFVLVVFVLSLGVERMASADAQLPTSRVSVSAAGVQGNGHSERPAISGDGQFITFETRATNLVPGDTNARADVMVFDRVNNTIERVSWAHNGSQGDDDSYEAAISGDGRYVAFTSEATNIVPSRTSRDGTTQYRGPGIHVYLRDRQAETNSLVSRSSDNVPADRHAWLADISADGRYVTFSSHAVNLMLQSSNGANRDPFLHDTVTGQLQYVAINMKGTNARHGGSFAKLSGDGQVVAYRSIDSHIVPNDTNRVFDIFVYELATGLTERVSVNSQGKQSSFMSRFPEISADGRFVVFETAARLDNRDTNSVIDIYIHDRVTHVTQLVSVAKDGDAANAASTMASVSGDGRYVSFLSLASNLVSNDTGRVQDVFVRDMQTGKTIRASVGMNGVSPNNRSNWQAISDNGEYLTYASLATNLVPGDTNSDIDVFVVQLLWD